MNFGLLSVPTNDGQRFLRTMAAGDFPITNSAVIVFSHQYATLPLIQVFAICVSPDNGWSQGDEVQLNHSYLGTTDAGVSIKYNGNMVSVSIGANGVGDTVSKTSAGTRAAITGSKWKLRIRMIG